MRVVDEPSADEGSDTVPYVSHEEEKDLGEKAADAAEEQEEEEKEDVVSFPSPAPDMGAVKPAEGARTIPHSLTTELANATLFFFSGINQRSSCPQGRKERIGVVR